MVASDKRVALMNEILNSIRLIKMYAWEEPFIEKIKGLRSVEIRYVTSNDIGNDTATL